MARVYSPQQASRQARVSEQLLRSWQRQGLLPTGRPFAPEDLETIRAFASFSRGGLAGKNFRRAVTWIIEQVGQEGLRQSRLVKRGSRRSLKLPGQEIELFSGQLHFRFDSADAVTMEAREKEKEHEQRRKRQEADQWFQRGLEMEQRGAPADQIIAAYKKAAELDEKSAGALVNLGTIYFNARMWRDSERYYAKAVEADANYPLAHFNLGNLYDERGDRNKAFHHYEEALRLKPGYADAHYNLALLHQGQGQIMKALKHWKTYLKLDPSSSWAAIARREMKKLQDSAVVEGAKSPSATRRFGKDATSA